MRIEKRVQEIYSVGRDLSKAAEGGIDGPIQPMGLAFNHFMGERKST
jgi:hypothetical protein